MQMQIHRAAPMKPLFNAALFQVTWFICLLGGSLWALVATFVYLFLHDRYFMNTRREWRLLGVFVGLGFIVDGTLFQLGVFLNNGSSDWLRLPPIWLICLWGCTASLFAHSLAFLKARYLLSSVLGLIGPTMSYFAGAKLAGISLAQPVWFSLSLVAVIWSMVLPLGVWLSERWRLFNDSK